MPTLHLALCFCQTVPVRLVLFVLAVSGKHQVLLAAASPAFLILINQVERAKSLPLLRCLLLAACCHCPLEYLAHCPGCRRLRVLPRAAIVSPFVRVLAFARPLVPAPFIVLIHFVKFI